MAGCGWLWPMCRGCGLLGLLPAPCTGAATSPACLSGWVGNDGSRKQCGLCSIMVLCFRRLLLCRKTLARIIPPPWLYSVQGGGVTTQDSCTSCTAPPGLQLSFDHSTCCCCGTSVPLSLRASEPLCLSAAAVPLYLCASEPPCLCVVAADTVY